MLSTGIISWVQQTKADPCDMQVESTKIRAYFESTNIRAFSKYTSFVLLTFCIAWNKNGEIVISDSIFDSL